MADFGTLFRCTPAWFAVAGGYGNVLWVLTHSRRKGKDKETRPVGDSYIPATETIYVRTWGCGHNNSDGEYMAGLLAEYGYRITGEQSDADLWILNSCAVKAPSEDSFNNAIRSATAGGKKVVVAGCVPEAGPGGKMVKGLSIVGVQQIDRVVEVVEETLKGNTVRLTGQRREKGKKLGGAALNLPKIRRNPLVEVVPINTGCLNQCTCVKAVHLRRGPNRHC
jgi:threonylcarbamoyladenosine tRNA methylthiotransferase CDKAL1